MTLPGTKLGPGVYEDHGTLHFDAVEYLRGHGIVVTDYNVALVERVFREQFAKRYPGVPIREVADR